MIGRIVFAVLVVAFLVLQYKLWFDKGSIPRAHTLEKELQEAKSKNDQAKQANARLDADVKDLEKAGEAIEERARSELGMVRKGETLVQVKEAPVQSAPTAPVPAKP